MKKTVLTGLILIAFAINQTSQAQLLKKIQNAAQNAAQNAVTPKNNSSSENPLSGMLDGMFQPAKTASSYSFEGFMVMQVISTDKKGKSEDPAQIKYLMTKDPQLMAMQFEDPKSKGTATTTIMDTQNQAVVILMEEDGNKSSIAMKMDFDKMQDQVDQEVETQVADNSYTLTKTGKTKTILGYTCEEYLITTEDGKGIYWVTEKPISGISMFSPQSNPMVSNKTMDRYQSMFSNAPEGTFMEMTFTDNDGSVTHMEVIQLEPNQPRTIQMSNYPNLMAGGR
ncbi:DUF4412 domain-containing protein [Algoriphagus sanaruensis]|uniref:DUF4412 domain-containing protein n=1 Tax=Algoriphagus sanaruensis TaxID=1727163 RepID=A0A142EQC3_9BACT|nr:DUF4412 domain-containing protein [Algoriphagus sanaruensis]AMQ57328.1 hypothetical protein AO498_12850 [Algoriphagus sanaruensis]